MSLWSGAKVDDDGVATWVLSSNAARPIFGPATSTASTAARPITSELILKTAWFPSRHLCPGVKGLRPAVFEPGALASRLAPSARRILRRGAVVHQRPRVACRQAHRVAPAWQLKLVDMLQEITKAQLRGLQLGRLKEAARFVPSRSALAKRNNVKMALNVPANARDPRGQWHHRRISERSPHVNLSRCSLTKAPITSTP